MMPPYLGTRYWQRVQYATGVQLAHAARPCVDGELHIAIPESGSVARCERCGESELRRWRDLSPRDVVIDGEQCWAEYHPTREAWAIYRDDARRPTYRRTL